MQGGGTGSGMPGGGSRRGGMRGSTNQGGGGYGGNGGGSWLCQASSRRRSARSLSGAGWGSAPQGCSRSGVQARARAASSSLTLPRSLLTTPRTRTPWGSTAAPLASATEPAAGTRAAAGVTTGPGTSGQADPTGSTGTPAFLLSATDGQGPRGTCVIPPPPMTSGDTACVMVLPAVIPAVTAEAGAGIA
jgi:hypothetical protein